MKIGIYGDSFADSINKEDHTWPTFLARKLGSTSISYYAKSGSSLFYSYELLKDTGMNNDLNLLVVTNPYRYTSLVEDKWVPNLRSLTNLTNFHNRRNLLGWFKSMDYKFLDCVHELFLSELENKFSKNLILIPSFQNSFSSERKLKSKWGEFALYDFTKQAISIFQGSFNIDFYLKYEEIWDINGMLCHIPVEWHEIVCDCIYSCIKNNQSFKFPKDLKLVNNFKNYWKEKT